MVHVNNEIPSQSNENIYIKSDSIWIYNQQKNYKNNKQIMSNPEIRKLWESFKNDSKYNRYFLSNEEEWIERLEKIKKYIDEHNKRPSTHDKNKDIESDIFLINIYIYRFIFFIWFS